MKLFNILQVDSMPLLRIEQKSQKMPAGTQQTEGRNGVLFVK